MLGLIEGRAAVVVAVGAIRRGGRVSGGLGGIGPIRSGRTQVRRKQVLKTEALGLSATWD